MKKNILFTLKYFNMFKFPLSEDELWRWLFKYDSGVRSKESREFFKECLVELVGLGKIETDGEFYFLSGQGEIVEIRKRREKISLSKIKKAQKMARLLAKVPWVRMIAVVSNLGYLNADDEADIDFFIVTNKNRIWLARFWCVVLMKLLNQRPNKKTTKDKICLSYFVDEAHLNLERTKIGEPDVHLIYLLSQYMPIYVDTSRRKLLKSFIEDTESLWGEFVRQNKWIKKYLPNFYYGVKDERFIVESKWMWWRKMIRKMIYDFDEKFYKLIEMSILPKHLRDGMKRKDKSVIIDEGILKLHSNDKRRKYNREILNFRF